MARRLRNFEREVRVPEVDFSIYCPLLLDPGEDILNIWYLKLVCIVGHMLVDPPHIHANSNFCGFAIIVFLRYSNERAIE
jgi:hypothetical protein